MVKPHFDFKISFQEENGIIIMIISTVQTAHDYSSKKVVITQDQYDALRFHFGTAEDQKNKIKHLTYFD